MFEFEKRTRQKVTIENLTPIHDELTQKKEKIEKEAKIFSVATSPLLVMSKIKIMTKFWYVLNLTWSTLLFRLQLRMVFQSA